MAQLSPGLYSLNSGVVSDLATARVDLQRLRVAASVQENLMPMVLGPAKFRPGTEYKTRTHNDAAPLGLPFVVNASIKALVEVTPQKIRVLIDGAPVTRPAVTSSVTNGTFTTDLTGWTDEDEGGATSAWSLGGYMSLLGNGTAFAKRTQQVTVVETNTEHALRVKIFRGPVTIRVGSGAGLDDYIAETILRTGEHSLGFTPTGDFHISLSCSDKVPRYVDSIVIEPVGTMQLPSPWGSDFRGVRYAQSADVLFIACENVMQKRIERRSMRAWSIVDYQAEDGPFRFLNATTKTITSSALTGSATLTASDNIFHQGHVGSLWQITHTGQVATAVLTGDDQYTDYIRVTGVGDVSRSWGISIEGTFVATVTLQYSTGEPGVWQDQFSVTAPYVNGSAHDGRDNEIVYYRLGIKSGNYTSGSVAATLTYAGGAQTGRVRITGYTSPKVVTADILSTIAKTTPTTEWQEAEWSDYRGWPTAVAFFDGRLWWAFQDKVYGSVSDVFDSYDIEVEGDSGPVIRSVATGPVEGIRWLLALQRLLAGTASQEVSMRASSFDEPITPTAFTARDFSNRGCADIAAVKVDSRGIYVQRNGQRVFEAIYSVDSQDYSSQDATRLAREICSAGIVGMCVQRQPDTRVWIWLNDGTAAVLTYEPGDEVVCWNTVTTNGLIKWVTVLPGLDDDEVYMAVQRTNGDGTIIAWEKMANSTDCEGGTISCNMDAFVRYTANASSTLGGLDHLEGLGVCAWADGKPYPGPYVVVDGEIDLGTVVNDAVVGLPYDGKFKTAKLAQGAVAGTALSKQKRIDHVSLIMNKVGWYGVKVGYDFDNMNRLQATHATGRPLNPVEVVENWDFNAATFNGGWGPDSRVCFKISSPYPGSFMGLALSMTTSEPSTFGARVSPGASG